MHACFCFVFGKGTIPDSDRDVHRGYSVPFGLNRRFDGENVGIIGYS